MRLPPFETFLEENRVPVYRMLLAVVGPQAADDCFQETFVSALRAYPRLPADSNLRGWALRIATNKAFDHLRSVKRSAIPVADLPERPEVAAADGQPELWQAVRSLPPLQRAAVVHRYVFDMTYAEVGETLGCSEDAARANAYEGRKKLRSMMEALQDA
ncbi:MAG: RNA polymerase sigma factor [Actinomycetota bacterium]